MDDSALHELLGPLQKTPYPEGVPGSASRLLDRNGRRPPPFLCRDVAEGPDTALLSSRRASMPSA